MPSFRHNYGHQARTTLSQANPVSTTLYTVLATKTNVRIYSIATAITWAVTQPTPLEIVVTIDGQAPIFLKSNPVSATYYFADLGDYSVAGNNNMGTTDYSRERAFLFEGKSVKIQARITWAITQPTPLEVIVKYAKK